MNEIAGFHMSQGLDVLQPKPGDAYPIPCAEWDDLKDKVNRFSSEPWFFHTLGSILVGAALSTWIALLIGTFNRPGDEKAKIIAWAVVVSAGLPGLLCMLFAQVQRRVRRDRGYDLIRQMEFIEQRFERKN